MSTTQAWPMKLAKNVPTPRGPLSESLILLLSAQETDSSVVTETAYTTLAMAEEIATDGDIQLTLFLLYSLHYGPGEWVTGDWEWNPGLISIRSRIESRFERELRDRVQMPKTLPTAEELPELLFTMAGAEQGPSLARWMAKNATLEQAREFLVQRSIYTLREADPHSWAIPRLQGRAKAALVEIQSDEYGGGRPQRMHSALFARTMEGLGLETRYGFYVDVVPPITLASLNMMSMFGLNRRLRGATAGHLAAFEMTSSIPNAQYARAFRRLGFGDEVRRYFDEHVEADAVHEQIAARDLAGSLAEDEPETLEDIVFGAAACLYVDGLVALHLYASWNAGRTSLLRALE
ncbi:iron-containing redox enzyme family protein [Salinibacterium hongtaonis]|uniref:Iron-containing redox enzyme family protein n=1 Tax=Homoserinimonas hongtaonis TaxID=2079791 RepID=A0A2U1T0X9_9MICO|nr:iron-containing redox enzyme family protein [Salinibacterium hongtaonis]AWB90044.1 hypothetical protein C2138_11270 [Salinibacterium hongtaonis]PWB97507.1 iron-containing redox enzyme family protein [Salinibacterium hongtaonis]